MTPGEAKKFHFFYYGRSRKWSDGKSSEMLQKSFGQKDGE